jgi:hypothetical protein
MDSKIYNTKIKKLSGTSYNEVYPQAISIYKQIASKTRRRPYVRSRHFNNEKVFLDYFWDHIRQKNPKDRARRLKYYTCGLDLIKNSNIRQDSKNNPNKSSEILHRFYGRTLDKSLFCVQIKESVKRREKSLISIFPIKSI